MTTRVPKVPKATLLYYCAIAKGEGIVISIKFDSVTIQLSPFPGEQENQFDFGGECPPGYNHFDWADGKAVRNVRAK